MTGELLDHMVEEADPVATSSAPVRRDRRDRDRGLLVLRVAVAARVSLSCSASACQPGSRQPSAIRFFRRPSTPPRSCRRRIGPGRPVGDLPRHPTHLKCFFLSFLPLHNGGSIAASVQVFALFLSSRRRPAASLSHPSYPRKAGTSGIVLVATAATPQRQACTGDALIGLRMARLLSDLGVRFVCCMGPLRLSRHSTVLSSPDLNKVVQMRNH